MLFKPELCQAILDGTKTQTRRLVQYGDGKLNLGDQLWFMQGVGSNLGSMVQRGRDKIPTVVVRHMYAPYRVKWQVGRTYAVQPGCGKPAIWIGPDGTSYDTPLAEYIRKAESGTRARWGKKVKQWLREHGYREGRIRFTAIRKERLQDITPEDGPDVWVLEFEVEKGDQE